jgi:hypothetical protein
MAEHVLSDDPPVTALGPRLAADLVVRARAGAGIRLDYSPRSLTPVERIIDGMRRVADPGAAVSRALTGLGAYTGEVLVRAAGAVWTDFDDELRTVLGQPFGVRTPDGRLWDPLGSVVKRYRNGPRDSLRLYRLYCRTTGARS